MNNSKRKNYFIPIIILVKRPKESGVLGKVLFLIFVRIPNGRRRAFQRVSFSFHLLCFVVWTCLCILRRKNKNIGKTDIFGGWWVASKFSYLRPMGDKIVCGFNVPKCGLRKPTNGFCIPTCHRPADKKISVPPKVMRRSQMLPF